MTLSSIATRGRITAFTSIALLLSSPVLMAHPGHGSSASSTSELLHWLVEPAHAAGPLSIFAILIVLQRLHERRRQRQELQRRPSRHD